MRNYVLPFLIAFALFANKGYSQSLGNDDCANAVTVPINGTCITGNNIGATKAAVEPSATCLSVDNPIWFKFVAPSTGPVVITNNDPGTNFNTELVLYTGTCGALTQVVCENDNGVAAGKATINSPCLIPGQTYYIMLDGYAGSTGTFCMKIMNGVSPSNDNCQCPITLPTNGSCVTGTTLNAANQWGSQVGCQSAASNVEVWYSFIATETAMTFNLSPTATGALTGNGEITVAKGNSCGTITTIAGSSCGPLPFSYSLGGLVVGANYYVTISTTPANAGGFILCGTAFNPPVISGQNCPDAAVLCNNTPIDQPTSNLGFGTQEVTPTNSCWGAGGERQSRWYKFTVGCTGPLEFVIDPVDNNNDYDWAIWDVTTAGCPTTANNTQQSVACNWQGIIGGVNGSTGQTLSPATACSALGALDFTANPACDPYAFINTSAGGTSNTYTPFTATAGKTYVMLIDNFSSSNSGFKLTWGNNVVIGPDATFTLSKNCFSITATKTCATSNTTYLWDFGDGTASTALNTVSHTYAADGVYRVTLTVTDALGCSRSYSQTVDLDIPIVNTSPDVAICSGTSTNLTATGTIVGGIVPVTFSNATSTTITDNNTNVVVPITVAGISPTTVGTNPIVSVCMNITHPQDDNLDISLQCPGGTTINLSDDNGGTGDNYSGTCFSPTATTSIVGQAAPFSNSYLPEASFTGLNACNINGTWNLIVRDDAAGNTGTINNWSITFNTPNTLNYSWSPATGLSATNIANPVASPTVTTTYTVTATDLRGCASTATVVVTVNPSPAPPTVTSPVTYCQNAVPTPLTATGTSLLWYTVATGGTGSATAPTPSTTTAGTTSYYVTQTVSGCESARAQIDVIVKPKPVATATPASQSFCSGGTTAINLTSTVPGSTFAWTVSISSGALTGASNGSGATIAQTLSNSATTAQTATYTITPTANGCPGNPITVPITVNPIPVATATPASASICSGTAPSIALTSNVAGTTFAWTVSTSSGLLTGASAGSGSTIAQTLTNTSTVNQTATYTVTPTAGSCVGTPITVVITVKPIPTLTATPSSQTICSGSATGIALTSNVTGTTFAWTVSANANITGAAAGSGSSITQTLTNTSTTVQTITYTVTPTANGCAGTPVAVVITVNPKPVATATPASQTFCSGGTTGINLTSNVTGSTFAWTVSTSSGLLTGASAGSGSTIAQTLTNTSTTAQTATYTITPTANGCPGNPITVVITVNPLDNPAFNYSSSTYCVTGTDPSANITGGATGTFTSSPAGLVFLNTTTGLIDLSASTAPRTYTITYTTNGVCPQTATFNVTITTAPNAAFSYAGPYCSNGTNPTPTFPAGASAGTFSSTAGLVFVSTTTGQINLSASTAGTYTVTNTIAAGGGCAAASSTNTVTINAAPAAPTVTSQVTYCQNAAAIPLTATGTNLLWYTVATGGTGTATAPTPVTTTAGTTSYYVSQTVAGCEGPRAQINVVVNPTPVATATPNTQTFCSGGTTSIALTSTVAGSTFSWTVSTSAGTLTGASNGTGATIAQTLSNSSTTNQTATYTITPTANGCPGASIVVTITVKPIPVATATPSPSTICSGGTTAVGLTSTVAGTTFDWTVTTSSPTLTGTSAGIGSTIAQTLSNSSTAPQTATYTITPTTNGCPGTPITTVVTVNPIPVVTATPNAQTFCSGGTTGINLTSNVAGSTFAWTVTTSAGTLTGASNGTGNSIAQTLTNSSSTAQTATYTITPTANGCPGTPITVVITVNPTPVLTATPNAQTLCSGATTSIGLTSSVAGSTFAWTVTTSAGTLTGASNGSGSTIAQTLTNSSTTAQTATYTITPTVNGCPGTPVVVVVTVNPIPVATATPANQTICSGAAPSIALTSTVAGSTFAWTVTTSSPFLTGASNASGSTIAQTLTNSSNTAQNATYVVTPTANGCSGTPITVTITVNPTPIVTATPSSQSICSGGTTGINLTSSVAGSTFSWTVSTSAPSLTGAANGNGASIAQTLTNSSAVTQTATYTITPTANGCPGTPITIVVDVNPIPVATATPVAQTICSGATTAIDLTSSVAGSTFSWTVSTSSVSVTGASNGTGSTIAQTLSNSTSTAQTATYTITPAAGTCMGTPITVVITINPLPVATATPAAPIICSGATTSITLTSNVAGSTFTWTVTTSAGTLTGASNGSGNTIAQTLTNSSTTAQTATYTVTPTANSCGTATPTQVTVTVNPIPNAVATPAAQTICSGSTTSIALTSAVTGTTFSWTVVTSDPAVTGASAGSGSTIAQTLSNSLTTAQTATYTITPSANGCPGTPITVVITINPRPVATATPASATICSGSTTSIALTSNVAGSTFTWTATTSDPSLTGASAGSGNTISQILTNSSNVAQTATYTITPTANSCGTATPTTVTVTVNPKSVVTATPAAPAICSGTATSISLTGSVTGTTFGWTFTTSSASVTGALAGSGSTIAQTLTNTSSTNQTVTYSVVGTANGCPGVPTLVVVTIYPKATTTATPASQAICSGTSTSIGLNSDVPGSTFAWTVSTSSGFLTGASSGSGTPISQTLTNSSTSPQTATYTVTATANGCPGNPMTVVVTVNPIPVATATPPSQAICSGSTTSIDITSNVAGSTFTWTVSTSAPSLTGALAGAGNTIAQTLTNSSNTAQTATYTITPSANGCGTATPTTVTVTVNPTSVATATPSAQTFCSGGTTGIALTSSVAGTTYSWTVATSSGLLTGASAGSGSTIAQTLTNTSTTAQTATYTVTPTANGCAGTPITVTITVNPLDNPAFNYSSSTYCQTGVDPTANITGGFTGTFTATPAGLVFLNSATGLIDLSASPLNTYTITFTTNGVCPQTSTFNLTITSAPSASFSYAGPYCTNGTNPMPTFPAGASAGTFSSAAGLVFVSTTTGEINLSASTPGTYTITNTIAAAGGCAAAMATATVRINATPVAPTVTTPVTYCQNAPATPLTATGTNLLWYTSATGGIGSPTAPTPVTTAAGTTSYYISQTNVDGCEGPRAQIDVIVNPTPFTTATPTTQNFCSGGTTSIALTSSVAGSTFTWTVTTSAGSLTGASNGSGAMIGQTLSNSSNTDQTATYTITPTANGCPGTAITVTITVKPIPVATATPSPSAICSGGTTAVGLTSTVAGTTFDWTVTTSSPTLTGTSAGVGSTIAQTLSNSSTSPQTATYTITPTATGCAGTPITTVVTVNPIPVVTATSATLTHCSGATTNIILNSNVTGSTFAWTVITSDPSLTGASNGNGNNIAQTLTNSSNTTQTATYTITPTANGCAGSPITVTVTVNPTPVTTTTPTSLTICSGSSTSIALTSSVAGSTFSWTVSTSDISLTGAANGSGPLIAQTLTNSSNTAQTATYAITPTASACSGTSTFVIVTVNPIPVATATPALDTICSGTAPSITLTGSVAGSTFDWTVSVTDTSLTGASNGGGATIGQTLSNSSNTEQTSTYSVTPTANGCPGLPINVPVTVSPTPLATATPSSQAICSGATTGINLTSSVTGTTFNWTVTTSNASVTGASNGNGATIAQTLSNSSTTPETATYTITPSANGCVGSPITVTITVNPIPVITATPTTQTICSAGSTTINLSSTVSGSTFSWTVSTSSTSVTGATNGTGNVINQTLSNSSNTVQTATYTITPSASACLGTPTTVVITVNPTPIATAVPAAQTICSGETTSIALTSSVAGSTFSWTVSSNPSITGASAGSGNTIAETLTNTSNVNQTVTYTITPSANGCTNLPITVTITVKPTPVLTATPSSETICSSGTTSITLTSNVAGSTFDWTVGTSDPSLTGASNGNGSSIVQTLTSTSNIAQTATYTITPTANSCLGTPVNVIVTVNPSPIATVTAVDDTICSGSTTSITLTSNVAGSTFGWTVTSTDPLLTGASAGSGNTITQTLTNTSTTAQTATYAITSTAYSCSSITPATFVIVVNPLDNASFNYSSGSYCVSAPSNPSPTITGLAGGTFSSNPVGLVFVNVNTGEIDVANSISPVRYTVTYLTNGVCPNSSTDTLSIITNPANPEFAYGSASYCKGTSNPTPTYPSGGFAGTFSSIESGLVFVDINTGEINLASSTPGVYQVVNSIGALSGCSPVFDTVTVTIFGQPVATFTGLNPTYCLYDDPSTLVPSVLLPPGTFNGPGISGSTFDPAVAGAGTHTVEYVVMSAEGCSDSSSVSTIVNPSPSSAFTGLNAIYCSTEAIDTLIVVTPGGTITGTGVSGTNPIIFDPSLAVPGTIVEYIVSANGCSDTTRFNITVNQTPDPSFTGLSGNAYCQRDLTTTLVSATTGGTFSGPGVSGTTFDPSIAGPGVHDIKHVVTVNGCTDSSIVQVNVNPTIIAGFDLGGQGTFCQSGTNPVANISGGVSGTFTGSTGLVIDPVTGEIDLMASTTGSHTVTFTTTGNCPDDSTISITITNAFDANFSFANASYCLDSTTVTPTFTTGSAGVFSSTAGLVFVNATTGEIDLTNSAPGAYDISNVITASGGCASDSAAFQITLNALPTATISGNDTICAGTSMNINLTGSAPWNFVYSDGTTPITVSGQASSPYVFTPPTPGTYVLSTLTDANCATTGTIANTSVVVLDSIRLVNVTVTCNASNTDYVVSFEITGGDSSTYVVTSGAGNTGSISSTAPYTFTSNSILSGSPYDFTVTDFYNCSPRNITGTQTCSCPVSAVISGDSIICNDGTSQATITITLTGTTPPWNFTYTDGTTNYPVVGWPTTTYTFTSSTTATFTMVDVTDATNCLGSVSGSGKVTVVNLPDSSFTGFSTSPYCKNNATVILTPTVAGGTFTGTGINGSQQFDPGLAGPGTHQVQYTVTDANGCTNSSIQNVIVNTLPDANFTGLPASMCINSSPVSLNGTIAGGSFSGEGVINPSANVYQFDPTTVTAAGVYSVTYTVADLITGCVNDTSLAVRVNSLPTANISGGGTTCMGQPLALLNLDLTGNGPWTVNYFDGTSTSTINVSSNPYSFMPSNVGTYSVTAVTDGNNCSNTGVGSVIVEVSPLTVNAAFTATPDSGAAVLPVTFTNLSTGSAPLTYLWNFDDGSTGTSFNAQHLFKDDKDYNVSLVATNSVGCTDTAYMVIKVKTTSIFEIPNVFSPNGDGQNDVFNVKATGLEKINAMIFDRWGIKIYEWDKVNQGWDGKTQSGVDCAEGVYYYIINAEGADGVKYPTQGSYRGYLHLVR